MAEANVEHQEIFLGEGIGVSSGWRQIQSSRPVMRLVLASMFPPPYRLL